MKDSRWNDWAWGEWGSKRRVEVELEEWKWKAEQEQDGLQQDKFRTAPGSFITSAWNHLRRTDREPLLLPL